jgi:ubiquinone/menaquinone biosynthesis C-methylase UbiE
VQKNFESRNVTTHLQQGDVLKMPYEDNFFDTVLLISILEHLKPEQQPLAFAEMRRVLKPGGQVVYGVPIERPFMVFMLKLLGHDIRKEHFSTQTDVEKAASGALQKVDVIQMHGRPGLFGAVYEVGHFRKP